MKYKCNNYLHMLFIVFIFVQCVRVDRDSSVRIENRFGLDDPELEYRWGEIFRTRPDCSWGPPTLHKWVPGIYREENGQDVALTAHTLLAPKIRKEYSYTRTLPLRLRDFF
jgi:hypothetical protein